MNNILILDDDFAIRLLYKVELADEGYHVIDTDDCENILDIIGHHMPDLIILDIMLGQFNGLDILQEIRNEYYDMPIILCSAYATFKYDMKSIAADYYVTKSADLKRLKTVVKMALETKIYNTENLFWEFQERNPLVSDEAELGFT